VGIAPFIWQHHLGTLPWTTRARSARGYVISGSAAWYKRPWKGGNVDVAVDCPVEAPAWLMGISGFLGGLSCGMPRAL